MSWSLQFTGKAAAVRAAVQNHRADHLPDFEKPSYEKTKESIEGALELLNPERGVSVTASGSGYQSETGGVSLQFQANIAGINLTL